MPAVTRALVALLAGAAGSLVAAPAGAATPPIMITKIYYDPPGADTPRTNARLNREYIQLRSNRSVPTNLYRWWLRDAQGHRYTFAGPSVLGAGRTVVLRTGTGTNTSTTRYWGLGNYVWNNTGTDSARLYNPVNALVDSCSYRGGGTYAAC
ncbi:hypothetical protein GCM10010124_37850 [Pilimelia terevasa]|uniref:LTD domain-containing protein n=1 Tax=Pilimelia terevasa TaxID=53372 RepID=A0A8J3BTK7_9ACTN|nr:lamin tail domain-containing protein [Pilimelia terevasa]GGK41413.1 hypothetical protein GCM10010124_37850 [Pilimelia terevasa]